MLAVVGIQQALVPIVLRVVGHLGVTETVDGKVLEWETLEWYHSLHWENVYRKVYLAKALNTRENTIKISYVLKFNFNFKLYYVDPILGSHVSCGNHHATSCSQCTQNHSSAWCNGDCRWSYSSSSCVDKRNWIYLRLLVQTKQKFPEYWSNSKSFLHIPTFYKCLHIFLASSHVNINI